VPSDPSARPATPAFSLERDAWDYPRPVPASAVTCPVCLYPDLGAFETGRDDAPMHTDVGSYGHLAERRDSEPLDTNPFIHLMECGRCGKCFDVAIESSERAVFAPVTYTPSPWPPSTTTW